MRSLFLSFRVYYMAIAASAAQESASIRSLPCDATRHAKTNPSGWPLKNDEIELEAENTFWMILAQKSK